MQISSNDISSNLHLFSFSWNISSEPAFPNWLHELPVLWIVNWALERLGDTPLHLITWFCWSFSGRVLFNLWAGGAPYTHAIHPPDGLSVWDKEWLVEAFPWWRDLTSVDQTLHWIEFLKTLSIKCLWHQFIIWCLSISSGETLSNRFHYIRKRRPTLDANYEMIKKIAVKWKASLFLETKTWGKWNKISNCVLYIAKVFLICMYYTDRTTAWKLKQKCTVSEGKT